MHTYAQHLLAAYALFSQVTSSPTKRDGRVNAFFGNNKVRGVNLGGWFVLEPWITPSLFEATPDNVVDEYTFNEHYGPDTESVLQDHWDNWIKEADFAKIASVGLNLVRIPVGYWSVIRYPGDPYVATGAYAKLAQALDWASTHNLKVMIDLHGVPLSQNGFDNSGQKGSIGWGQADTIYDHTINVLNKIRDDHAAHPAVIAIELVNEPMASSVGDDKLRRFYMDGWGNLKNSDVAVTFHDGFEGVNSWNDWGSGMWNLVLDTHHYEIFDPDQLKLTPQEHINTACAFGQQMKSNNKWTVAGEWCGAQTDCAKWLNGRGVGARYDGTFSDPSANLAQPGSCDGLFHGHVAELDSDRKTTIKNFVNAQLDAFEQAAGWIWWTWKTEGAPEWDLQELLDNGLFPNPVSGRNVPGLCGA